MDLAAIGQTAGTARPAGDTPLAALSQNFDNFLLLLTKQLQYQDPLSPLDTHQFTQQLVQFTGVEQAINTNKKLDALIALQSGGQAATAVSYLGTTIEAESDRVALAGGEAEILYELPRQATGTVIVILDASGKPVRVERGEVTAGQHRFVWDGTDNDGGSLPDGVYGVEVSAVDAEAKAIPAALATLGRVDGVDIRDGQIYLRIGGLELPFSSVRSVRES